MDFSTRATGPSLKEDESIANSSSRWWLCCLGSKKYSVSRSSKSSRRPWVRKMNIGPSSIKLRQKQLKKMQELRDHTAVVKKPISKILIRNNRQGLADRAPIAIKGVTCPTSYEQMAVTSIGSERLRPKLSVSTMVDSWSSQKNSPRIVAPRKASVSSSRRKRIIINMHAEAEPSTREKSEYSINVSGSTSSTSYSTSKSLSSVHGA
eukprot:jgi/Bigna1/71078/fgenesh1_pg.14_\